MKMYRLKIILIIQAIVSAALACFFAVRDIAGNPLYVVYLPLELLGNLLRKLSLMSDAGNVLAVGLYLLTGLVPAGLFVWRMWKGNRLWASDWLLPVMSGFWFYMMYYFVNPQLMMGLVPDWLKDEAMILMMKFIFSTVLYSLAAGYLLIRAAARTARSGGTKEGGKHDIKWLMEAVSRILVIWASVYIAFIFYIRVYDYIGVIRSCLKDNTIGTYGGTAVNILVMTLRSAAVCLPELMTLFLIITAIGLTGAMKEQMYGEAAVILTRKISLFSRVTVYVSAGCCIFVNVLQLICLPLLNRTDFKLDIPLFPLALAVAAMLLSRYFEESNRMYEEKQLII